MNLPFTFRAAWSGPLRMRSDFISLTSARLLKVFNGMVVTSAPVSNLKSTEVPFKEIVAVHASLEVLKAATVPLITPMNAASSCSIVPRVLGLDLHTA